MKKILKDTEIRVICECMLYLFIIIMGALVMLFPSFGMINPIYYASILFYIFAFLSIFAYFVDRKNYDYELLFLSLICVLIATALFLLQKQSVPLVLGTGILVFTFLQLINRGYKIIVLKRNNSYTWVIKFIVTFLIGFLGLLTIFNFYQEVTVQTLMLGYYFITLGIMCISEPLLLLLIKSDTFETMVKQIIKEENKNEEKLKQNSNPVKKKKTKKTTKTNSIQNKKVSVKSTNKNKKSKTNTKASIKKLNKR